MRELKNYMTPYIYASFIRAPQAPGPFLVGGRGTQEPILLRDVK